MVGKPARQTLTCHLMLPYWPSNSRVVVVVVVILYGGASVRGTYGVSISVGRMILSLFGHIAASIRWVGYERLCHGFVCRGMVSAHGVGGIGKVTDEGLEPFFLDGDGGQGSFAQHLHAVVLGGAPINPRHGGHVVVGRELGEQGIVALAGEAVGSRGILHGFVMRDHVVDIDHVTA